MDWVEDVHDPLGYYEFCFGSRLLSMCFFAWVTFSSGLGSVLLKSGGNII